MTDAVVFTPPTISRPATWPRSGLLVALVGAVMTAMLGWMVIDRILLLGNGREIVLPVIPIDPRSLFRGDYVILNFDVSQVPSPAAQDDPRRGPPRVSARPLYVTLEQDAAGTWKAVATAFAHPGKVADNRIVLQGRPENRMGLWPRNGGRLRLRYGIESYFVPEGTGLALERLVRDKKISVRVAVNSKGRAAIKGLMADGKPIHDEPLL